MEPDGIWCLWTPTDQACHTQIINDSALRFEKITADNHSLIIDKTPEQKAAQISFLNKPGLSPKNVAEAVSKSSADSQLFLFYPVIFQLS